MLLQKLHIPESRAAETKTMLEEMHDTVTGLRALLADRESRIAYLEDPMHGSPPPERSWRSWRRACCG